MQLVDSWDLELTSYIVVEFSAAVFPPKSVFWFICLPPFGDMDLLNDVRKLVS